MEKISGFLRHYKKQIIILVFLAAVFFINKRSFMYWALISVSALFNYFHDMKNKTIFDARLHLVIGVMVSRHYGFFPAILFYLLSTVLPNIMAGGRLDASSLVFHVFTIILYGIVPWFPEINIIIFGILIVLTDGILGIFINIGMGIPSFMALAAACFAVVIRIIQFMTIGALIEALFAYI